MLTWHRLLLEEDELLERRDPGFAQPDASWDLGR
jgi:hypothetical protein